LSTNRTPGLGCRLISGPVRHHKFLGEVCVGGTCTKYFILKVNLKKHIFVHSGEKATSVEPEIMVLVGEEV